MNKNRLRHRHIIKNHKKGTPSGVGVHKAGYLTVDLKTLKTDEEIADKYTEGADEEPAINTHIRHHNRNLNKVSIAKLVYS